MKDEKAYAEKLRKQYLPASEEENKLERLCRLDKAARRPAEIFAYAFGAAGTLVLGTGMCLAMKVIGNLMPLGVAVGLLGIAMIAANYFIYRAILRARKKKYAKEILALSGELLHTDDGM